MKDCFGNYLGDICKNHNQCEFQVPCYQKTWTEKGACECPYKKSCHIPRQYLQARIREENPGRTIEDCDFYKMIDEKVKI